MKNRLERLCVKYQLGQLVNDPELITGGLLHKMYYVRTSQGEYAVKWLNPDIMKRPEALRNMINSEIIANELKKRVPLVAARRFQENSVIEDEGHYYMVFDRLEGVSVFAPEITRRHCEQIGRILGKIHSANIQVDSMEKIETVREVYDWNRYLELAKEQNSECYLVLKEHVSDIMHQDTVVVDSLGEVLKHQVISHRDLDPKNVMWKNSQPYVIDWESAGYVNPYQELVEILNYWITEQDGNYSKEKFEALFEAYKENMTVSQVNWGSILNCSADGMLGWLEYSVKRALGIEGTGAGEREEGLRQTKGTLAELRKYEAQMVQLKNWLEEYNQKRWSVYLFS